MNKRSSSSFNSPRRGRLGFISPLRVMLLVCLLAGATEVKAQQPNWSPTGDLNTGRFAHTTTLLMNGNVLASGGRLCSGNSCTEFSSAELYDAAAGTWSATGNMSVPRHAHVSVRLPNGKVLVAGGNNGATTWDSAELYDPANGGWTTTGSLSAARAFATATLLTNGKVLVAGGGAGNNFLSSAELYDPATGAWSPAGTMTVARGFHTATLLADGRVLVAAGASLTSGALTLRNSAELYDPASGSWTTTGSLATARVFHTETLLPTGKVLVTGGSNFSSVIYDTAELYDPATGLWSATGRMTTARISHTATLLANGKVLAAAGFNNEPVNFSQRSAELFNPATENWSPTADLNTARGNHKATLLEGGKVLISGGNGGGSPATRSSELFDGNTAPPQITGASVSGKKLFVQGQGFDDGADILVNDEKQKTANDNQSPNTLLVGKKAGKKIARGGTVRLKVRNSDGTESAEFSYTRPAQ
jgi:N-acetylneuraminic acid mutarotase